MYLKHVTETSLPFISSSKSTTMKPFLLVFAIYLPVTLFAQFPLDLAPVNDFNDLILLRDVNSNPKWHMKIQSDGGLGFSESNVADGRLILNPGGGISLFGGSLGINVFPDPAVTLSIKAQSNDTWAIYADDTASDVKFYVLTNGDAFLKGSLSQNSDARLKTSILKLTPPRASLNNINGYSYFWKNNPANDKKQIGLLAQEVMAAYPELVSKAANGTLAVNYTGFIPILIEAFKDQSNLVEQQHEKLNQLELRMKVLEDKLNRL